MFSGIYVKSKLCPSTDDNFGHQRQFYNKSKRFSRYVKCAICYIVCNIRPLLNVCPTYFPIYCNFGPTLQLFIFALFEGQLRLSQFLGRTSRLVQARRPGAAATSPSSSCKTTCQQVGCIVQRIQPKSEVEYGGFAQVERYTIVTFINYVHIKY